MKAKYEADAATETCSLIRFRSLPRLYLHEINVRVSENMTIVRNTERTPTRETFQSLLAYTLKEPIVRIADIVPDGKNPWVKIQLTVDRTRHQLTYTACPKCKRTITVEVGEKFYCFTCNGNQVAEPRCKLKAGISDDSDTIRVTLFDRATEELLGKNTNEL